MIHTNRGNEINRLHVMFEEKNIMAQILLFEYITYISYKLL